MKSINQIIKNNFFRPRWYSVFLNPNFIDRFSILSAVKEFAKEFDNNASILDVGCGLKPYRQYFDVNKYIGIDIDFGGHDNNDKNVDKYYNGEDIPFEDNSFDAIICTQVIEHVENPKQLLSEMFRVLKKDGLVLLTIPFCSHEHEQPYDFWRFTRFANNKLMSEAGFQDIEIKETCGFFSVLGQLFSAFIFDGLKTRKRLLKLIISIFVLGPIQIISIGLDRIIPNNRLTLNYAIRAKK